MYTILTVSFIVFTFFLPPDLEWKVLYVGSAHDSHKDQVLDEILVGPVPVGLNKFVLQADAPDPAKLDPLDILGVTVVLVTCSYQSHEFVRVGYYVNNEYTDPNYSSNYNNSSAGGTISATDMDEEDDEKDSGSDNHKAAAEEQSSSPTSMLPPPPKYPNLDMSKVQRQILADKPRVTKFPIPWGAPTATNQNDTSAATLIAKDEGSSGMGIMATPSTMASSNDGGTPMECE